MKAVRRGNDPTSTGEGGRISYKIRFLSTRFNCRGRDENGSQFFFTLGSASELQSKHTIFGKVTEETIYNMLKLKKAPVDENDRQLYAPKMIKTIILNNPFSDIKPRIMVQEKFGPDSIILCNEKFRYKDFNLLSFGEAAEEDEEESVMLNKKFSDQGKSAHDYLTDLKLSS
ncbi:Peptidyl-prolyl isomerase cwc27 [Eufriesea mexicana]|uniref:Spliceosome-associated protein CWC27 homolog n=1 Tax=Eufriesea mexicana TaxID=516756 RepID=A0A310S510_9HYME|nr:Peptidyl-prolyl isomerase cwc27 [Eufriesea mexicana]